ncbi:FAD-binding protein [Stutzerimonas xanthomarina]|uniref:FAD-binding protein n=1 Tax=Stutzerimonas xanthomarina TaxID=271420 RepID=UPI003AA88FD0
MRAAQKLSSPVTRPLWSRFFLTRSHTVSAQGGSPAPSLRPIRMMTGAGTRTIPSGPDHTVTRTLIEYMCSVGPKRSSSSTWAAVFPYRQGRTPASVRWSVQGFWRAGSGRTCAAADRTGCTAALHQGNLKNDTVFLNEWYAVDLVKNQDARSLVLSPSASKPVTVYIRSKATVLRLVVLVASMRRPML